MKTANVEKDESALQRELLSTLPTLLPTLRIRAVRRLAAAGRGEGPQASVEVQAPGGRRRVLQVAIRAAAAPSRLAQPIRQLKVPAGGRGAYPVLAARFLSPRAQALCRQAGIGYVDLAGNCWLQWEGVYIEKSAARNPFPARGRPASVFAPVASRVVRALLEEPQRAWHFTDLAQAAGVSLGQAHKVAQRLRDEAYLDARTRHIRVTDPAGLLDAWAAVYAQQPRAAIASYYALGRSPEELLPQIAAAARARGWRYAVTSFAAASQVAPFVRGVATTAWYTDQTSPAAWAEALDLRPVESGPNVLILPPPDPGVFYRTQEAGGAQLVGNVQLYLDLMREPGRGPEQAAFLRQQRLAF